MIIPSIICGDYFLIRKAKQKIISKYYRRIVMQIHTISMGFVNAYLVEMGGGLALVDTGIAGQEQKILARAREVGGEIKLIYITHAHGDHTGSAAALRRLTGAPVVVHRLDGPAMASGHMEPHIRRGPMRLLSPLLRRISTVIPLQADRLLDDGDRLDEFGLAGSVVLLAGHTPGSTCLRLDDGTGFLGDLVSTNGDAHLQRSIVDDYPALRDSFQRLRTLGLTTAFVGHGRRALTGSELTAVIDAELELVRA
jgi:hydroxyacylglutathione hydrolase